MDIGNILNAKGNAAAAAAAEARRQQQLAPSTPMTNRSNSDLGSEQGSTSSQPQPLHPSNNSLHRYPSPVPTAQNLPMMPSEFHADDLPDVGYPQIDVLQAPGTASNLSKKSFACSHCSKGFTRRSDLARHGRFNQPLHDPIIGIDTRQNEFTVVNDRMCATGLAVVNPSFNDRL